MQASWLPFGHKPNITMHYLNESPLYPTPPRCLTRHRLRLLALPVAAVLNACASLAPSGVEGPAAPVPATWSAATAAATSGQNATSLTDWWQRFNDPALSALVTLLLRMKIFQAIKLGESV